MIISVDGKISKGDASSLPILDRGFLYGDGVFESLRTYNHHPFLLDAHIKRLLAGAKQIQIKASLTSDKIKAAVYKTISEKDFPECYIKIIITRGSATCHGLDFSNCCGKPRLIVIVEELKESPSNTLVDGWAAIISSIKKADVPTSRIKSLCYLDNAIAFNEAKKNGAREGFLLDEKGHVIEGSISNIFIVKHSTLITPPAAAPILCGITREMVVRLAKQSAMVLHEKNITPKEIYNCDECFITMSAAGIIPITRIWNRKIGRGKRGPITEKITRLYQDEISAITHR